MAKRIACLLVVSLLIAADKPTDAAKKDLDRFQGEWKVEKAQRGGEAAPPEKMRVTVSGDSLSIDAGGARDEKATITLDPAKTPATIDMKLLRGNKDVVPGIYKLDGDTLTVCWAKEGGRPAEFASKEGTEQVLLVLKRVKK